MYHTITSSGDCEGKLGNEKAQFGAEVTSIINGIVSNGIKDTLTLDISLRVKRGDEGRWGMLFSMVSEVGSSIPKPSGGKEE